MRIECIGREWAQRLDSTDNVVKMVSYGQYHGDYVDVANDRYLDNGKGMYWVGMYKYDGNYTTDIYVCVHEADECTLDILDKWQRERLLDDDTYNNLIDAMLVEYVDEIADETGIEHAIVFEAAMTDFVAKYPYGVYSAAAEALRKGAV